MAGLTPRFEVGAALVVAGLCGHYDSTTKTQIPALWQRFVPLLQAGIPGQAGWSTYGVCFNADGEGGPFDYLCGVAVTTADAAPDSLAKIEIPPARYAVFSHRGRLRTLANTWARIFEWLRSSGNRQAGSPYFEWYSADFCDETGTGQLEIWIPIE
jgi:AraC family transcriptional regulator